MGAGEPSRVLPGDVQVTGDLVLLNQVSGDIAEDFDLEDGLSSAEPGTVLVIHSTGKLSACTEPYDTRVAGVVSVAGDLQPAIVLQRLHDRPLRSPIALVGKAFCKVDAAFGEIRAGDLLTTSATLGHAMKVTDRSQALGAVVGKALAPLARDAACSQLSSACGDHYERRLRHPVSRDYPTRLWPGRGCGSPTPSSPLICCGACGLIKRCPVACWTPVSRYLPSLQLIISMSS